MQKNHTFFRNLITSLILFSASCAQAPKPVDPSTLPIPVKTQKVGQGSSAFSNQYPATINALNQTDLRTNVSGYITGIYFREGEPVKKGQKLYEIDRSKYAANYDQAVASFNIAKANLDRAAQDANRYQTLLKQDAIAKQQVDHALTDLQNAKLQVVVAGQAIKNAQTDLRYSRIVAPFGGTIGISQVRLGALVQSGQTLLNTISSPDPIAADVIVSEQDLGLFQKISQAKSVQKDSIFRLILPDKSTYGAPGHITVIDRAIDPQTGTLTVRLSFANPKRQLRPGMNVNLVVRQNGHSQSLMIPAQSVTEIMGELFVFAVRGNKVHQLKIEAGRTIGSQLVVTGGLNAGEEIVTEGTGRLREGSTIKKN